jgi:hypothetical protein
MGGDDDEPWDAEVALRNYLAEAFNPTISNMLMKGAPRGIGVDISGRVGINNLLLPDVQEGLEGKSWWDSAASAALGPIGGIGANVAKGAQEISEGHNLRGVESMLPVFLKTLPKPIVMLMRVFKTKLVYLSWMKSAQWIYLFRVWVSLHLMSYSE